MTWDPVPWAVGGGALHSPEVARTFADAATGGAEGIVRPTDLRVVPLAVPGGKVRVLPGSCLVTARSSGSAGQSYAARNAGEDVVTISPTGAGVGRSDLIVARIEDPFAAGEPWQDPTDPTVGPYVFTRVIPNVPAGTTSVASLNLGYSAIALARVDLPASTGTVTAAMIKDLRTLARPRRTRDLYLTQPTATSSTTSTSYAPWTGQADRSIVIPEWATQVKIIGTVSGARAVSAAAIGQVRVVLGPLAGQGVVIDFDAATRQAIVAADTFAVPATLRGKTQTLQLQAARTSGTGSVTTDQYSTIVWDVEFLEVPSAD